MIFKLAPDVAALSCHGIYIDSNTFTSNYGCYQTFGNVVVDCEPNDNIHGASSSQSTDFDSYYSTYNLAVNQNWETDQPPYATHYNTTYYMADVSTNLSSL
jgi:hypothetical protein